MLVQRQFKPYGSRLHRVEEQVGGTAFKMGGKPGVGFASGQVNGQL